MNIKEFGKPFKTVTYRRYIKIMQCMKANMDDRTYKFQTLKTRIAQSFKAQYLNAQIGCSNITLAYLQWLSNLRTKFCKLLKGNHKESRSLANLKKS